MKPIQNLAILGATAALIGCASPAAPPVAVQAPAPICAFQDGQGPYDTPAPMWVCTEEFPTVAAAAVGSFQNSNMGYDFMVEMATSRARQKLAREISSKAASSIKDYRATTGSQSAGNETTLSTAEITQRVLSQANLVGSRVLTKTRNPKTGMAYVIVGFKSNALDNVVEEAAQAAFAGEAAEFQRFKASQSFDQLKSDLADE
ncbi:MAG: hypothetical protein HOM48_00945 [Rhodobiaceae bacterium]|jgi:hypothetical protein|nr:hypothetical protein [Rhodobiaceae bacterium]MDG2496419.1 hypothetical protein [Alphaproteobacteria bacterium]